MSGLRNERKPGYCWQENELYDTFQPIIGGMAVLVYVQMTRECVDPEAAIDFSLRDLARSTGLSKDTVQRAAAVMQHVGMIRIDARGGPRRSAVYRLIDLKDLVLDLGGALDRKRRSYALPEETVGRLRTEVKALIARFQRKTSAKKPAEVMSLRATYPIVEKVEETPFFPLLESDKSVAQSDSYVAPERHISSYRKTKTKTTHPLPPPRREGAETPSSKNRQKQVQTALAAEAETARKKNLRTAQALWTGVMSEFDKHLLANRPKKSHLADGYGDWQRYRFDSLAVREATMCGDVRLLAVSSPDPPATETGLLKYAGTWQRLLRKWFGLNVEIEIVAETQT